MNKTRSCSAAGVASLFYQGDVNHLPARDGSFDCVLSCAVLLHLPRPEAEAALLEFHRVLKESGKLILVTSFPNALTPEGLQNALYSALRPRKNGPARAYLRRDVERLLRPFGAFQILENRSSLHLRSFAGVPLPFRRIGRAINARLTLGPLVSHYDIVATK